ncbi:MAG: aprE [Frankiales bacterium]|nr:aprE [Frankiales bacterium]
MRLFGAVAAAAVLLVTSAPAQAATARPTERTWHGNQIHMYDAQSVGRYGQGVTVAVIDGWVDGSHPDFQGRVKQGASCASGSCVAGQKRDACTHGTHVAGIVASSSFGVAQKATVLPVQVLLDDGKGGCTGRPADVAAGIRWAMSHGAQVINLSLGAQVPGVSQTSAIPDAVAEAANAGIVVVFSAGNASQPLADSYNGNALVVAATGPSGQLASYSQYGAGVDVAAPGGEPNGDSCTQAICVTSLYPGSQYAVAAGTSQAAPHVSGIAALLLAKNPSMSRSAVFSRIKSTAHPLANAGSGLVDARAALGATAAPGPTHSPTPPPVVVHPKPVTSPTRQPVVVKPRPTPAATKAPVVAAPMPTVSPIPRLGGGPFGSTPSPTPSSAPVALPQIPSGSSDSVPAPVAGLAGGMVALAAMGVMLVGLRRRA